MSGLSNDAAIVHEALMNHGKAIADLSRRTGTVQIFDPGPPLGMAADPAHTISMGGDIPVHAQPRPGMTEAFMGMAFVLAQEHIGNASTTKVHRHVDTLANYWKHRSTWRDQWANAHAKTRNGIIAINDGQLPADPPMKLGLLTDLIEKGLGRPFSAVALWDAISNIP